MGYDYVAIPWPSGAPDPQPELRKDLEALGFRLLGGCALAPSSVADVVALAGSYADRAKEFTLRAHEPGQVFVAPDGTAYAQLAWLWGGRYATLTTVLGDGMLVQTMTDWGVDPVWPQRLARHYASTTDRHAEQLVLATDADVEVVDGVEEAWSAHRQRLAAMRGPVPSHERLDDFVSIWAAESRVRSRWSSRVRWTAGLLAFVAVAVPYLAVSRLLGEQAWWVDIAVVVAAVLCVMPLHLVLWLRVRHWRWLRPVFRAPVTGQRPPVP